MSGVQGSGRKDWGGDVQVGKVESLLEGGGQGRRTPEKLFESECVRTWESGEGCPPVAHPGNGHPCAALQWRRTGRGPRSSDQGPPGSRTQPLRTAVMSSAHARDRQPSSFCDFSE